MAAGNFLARRAHPGKSRPNCRAPEVVVLRVVAGGGAGRREHPREFTQDRPFVSPSQGYSRALQALAYKNGGLTLSRMLTNAQGSSSVGVDHL